MGKTKSQTKYKTGKKTKRFKRGDEVELWEDQRSHVV